SPEFRNRLDATVVFDPLDPVSIARVVDKNLAQLRKQLAEKGVTIELSEAALAWLAEKGFDKLFGARPMARLIEQELKRPLADEVLFGRLAEGGRVKVDVAGDKLAIEVEAAAVA
ncbi:ATP-dependent Clp protease ATP-binding subunit ClpA, partial [bacterium]|nr:ATP-dependent Clp protease ATP-binding subunit ClpA [bacterium]